MEPATLLEPPVPATGLLDAWDEVLLPLSLASPSWWIGQAMQLVWRHNPFTEVPEWFLGDWEQVARVVDLLEQLASFDRETAAEVRVVALRLAGTAHAWRGIAAEAAGAWLEELASSLDEQADATTRAAAALRALVAAVHEESGVASSAMLAAGDTVVLMGAAMAASTMMSVAAMPAAAVGYGLVLERGVRATHLLHTALRAADRLLLRSRTRAAEVLAAIGSAHRLARVPLPAPLAP